MRKALRRFVSVVGVAGVVACGTPSSSQIEVQTGSEEAQVGYDVRRLRPHRDEPLASMFERLRSDAVKDGKLVAVMFSADWCEACRKLELELGRFHPGSQIGHVRIFALKEEDWSSASRMNEFNALRTRWYPILNTYPLLIVLDESGLAIEEMGDAVTRLEHEGVEPTVPAWFQAIHPRTQ